jgi:hypothetical protein
MKRFILLMTLLLSLTSFASDVTRCRNSSMTITEENNLISVFHDSTSYLDAEVGQLRITKNGDEQIITKKSIMKQGVSSAVAKLRLTFLADDNDYNVVRKVVVEVNKGLRSALMWKHLGTCMVN